MVKQTARILYFVVVVLIQQHLCMSVCLSVRPSGPDRTRSNCFDACVNYVVTLLMYVRPSLRPDRTIVCLSVCPSGLDRTRSNCFDACVNYVVTLLMYVRPSLRPDRTIVCLSVRPSGLDRTRSNCFDACVNSWTLAFMDIWYSWTLALLCFALLKAGSALLCLFDCLLLCLLV